MQASFVLAAPRFLDVEVRYDMPSSPPRLLEIGPLPPGLSKAARERFSVHPLWQEADPAGFLAVHHGVFAGAVTMARHACSAGLLAAIPGGVIASFGVGTEKIDLEAAARFATFSVEVHDTFGVNFWMRREI